MAMLPMCAEYTEILALRTKLIFSRRSNCKYLKNAKENFKKSSLNNIVYQLSYDTMRRILQ